MAKRTDPKLVEPSGEHSPGAYLRQAREAADMSVGQVAAALFLEPKKIEALESDAFDRLAAPTFVRGYLRGYARVLGLPSEPVLEMYDRQGFDPPPLAVEAMETKQAHTSDIPVRLVTYAVGAVLVLLVGLWWKSQEDTGFAIDGGLLGWWSDPAPGTSLPSVEAPGTAQDGGETGGDSVATASAPPHEASQDGQPSMPSPGEGAAPASVTANAPAPAGGDTDGQSVAMTTDHANDALQGNGSTASSSDESATSGATTATSAPTPADGDAGSQPVAMASSRAGDASPGSEPTAPSAGDGAVPGSVPAGAHAPAGSDTGDRSVAPSPDRADRSSRGGEATVDSPGEGAMPAGTGPIVAGAGDSETMTDRGVSAAPGSRPEAAGRPEAAAGGAAPETATLPFSSETPPSETASGSSGAGADATAVLETARSGLVLAFAHESWVEIYDRERTRLFFGLVEPGRVLHFEGARPFDILFGYGKDVRVVIDGEVFDHTPYVNHGVARFSVGSAPASATDSAEPSDTGTPPDTGAPSAADPQAAASQPPDRSL